ncbi:MAG: RsfS/YbeB/iojap family protein, partial [Armatimonadetes bacterium]|nr:RsfS/YbeB/iojap family protein [Armatimonadota bacterium]
KKDLGLLVRRTGTALSRWVILDADDVVIHLFTADLRDFYDLEGLWGTAERWKVADGQMIFQVAVPT